MDLPDNTPLTKDQQKLMKQLWDGADLNQKAWMSAWFKQLGVELQDSASTGPKIPLSIIFGTEGGNCEALANHAAKKAKKAGFTPKVIDFADIEPANLQEYDNVIVYISTWGEGDPPERVEPFDKAFKDAKPDLSKMNFGICALGDTSYVDFCELGKQYDARFVVLGAKRIQDRVDCDVDFEDDAESWTDSILAKYAEILDVKPNENVIPHYDFGAAKTYSPKQPFRATLKEKVMLNGTGSAKETWHYEIDLSGSGMKYEVGDALGVVPQNDHQLVEDIMQALNITDGKLAEDLRFEYDITALTKPVIEKYAEITGDTKLDNMSDDELQKYIWGRGIIDLLQDYKHKLAPDQLRMILRKLPPRLYSISSSMASVGDEVHLTVASVRYNSNGRKRNGVASCYLADAVENGGEVKVYLKPNKNFRLPANGNAPVIMVGPGTGVAPFRAFMQEREETGAKGKNWLFFGDQHYNFDFLYQLEWQDWYKSGVLSKLDVAFSRDTPNKVYVQSRMQEKAGEIKKWIADGAYFYVCGDETKMAKDVDATLRKIVGDDTVDGMKKDGRYLRDVY